MDCCIPHRLVPVGPLGSVPEMNPDILMNQGDSTVTPLESIFPMPLVDSSKGAVSVMARLAAPFSEKVVRFKPGAFAGRRALAIPYVDVRVIEDRLDEVLGPGNWQDDYECLPGGSVTCRLKLRLDGEWITKMDVGGAADHMDEGDRRKAAFSDALKRAAVKFGIGRYLYRVGGQWLDYDPHKKQFLAKPRLQPELPSATVQ